MIFIPMKKERRVCVIILALLLNLTCALEWEVIEDFKRQLQESCRITADFEKSIADLEYTAFKFDGYEGNAHCLFGYYSEVFHMYSPNDALSIIEVQKNSKSVQDEPTLMSDMLHCLQKNVFSETTQVNQSENIKMNVHTIRHKDLYNYEVIRKDLDDMKKLNNTIQAEINCCISNLVLSSIEFFIPSFIIDAIRTYYEYAFRQGRYFDGKIDSIEVSDFTGVKIAILKAFIDGSFATKARDTIKMFFANVNGVIGQMVDSLMSFQDKNGLDIYNRLALEAKIREYFRQNLDNMLNNYLSQLVNRLSVKIEKLPVQSIRGIYGWVIPMIKRSADAARTEVSNINGQNVSVVDQMSDEEKDRFNNSNTAFLKAISLIQCIRECKNLRYSCKLIRLNSAYRNECIRIFCNDVIGKDNFLVICHILSNIEMQICSNTNQLIFINVRRGNDLDGISKQIEKLHMDEKYEYDYLLPNNTIVNKCILYTKKRGKRSLSKFTIDFNHTLDLAKSCIFRDENLLLDKIRDYLKQNCSMVKIESFNKVYIERDTITYDDGGICLKQPNHPTLIKRTIVISIIVGREIYEIVFNLCGDKNSFEVIEAICPPYPNFNNDIAISKDNCKIKKYTDASQMHFLSGLLGYLQRMQFMSKVVIHPDFINERKHQNKFFKEIRLPISSTPVHKINDYIDKNFVELRDKIDTYHLFCPDTINVYAVEMHLADFLMRNNDLQKWYNRMESFLKASNINHTDFENLLDEFIYEHDRMSATNDQDISHINTRDYKIQVYAVLRKNSNTLLYLVRRELEFDLNVLPLTFALDTYVDFLNNFDSYSKTSSLKDLNVTNDFNAIFIRYVFKTMVKLRFDMLGDLKEQFETNKEQFKKVLFTFINPYRLLPIQIAINPKSGFISNCNISLYNIALVKVLENEILGIIEAIEQHQMQMQSEASIKVTVISLKDPDGSDLQDIDDLNSQLQNFL